MAIKELSIKIVAYLAALVVIFVLSCYLSSILLMNLNGLSISDASLFTAFDYYQVYRHSEIPFIKITVIVCAAIPFLVPTIFIPLALYLYKAKGKSLHGDARFATYHEIKKAKLVELDNYDKTILVGKLEEKNEYLCYGGYQFVMLAAPTRSGKGVGIVIPNCLNYSDSLVVLDIKLENFDITSGFRAKNGQEVYLFAPFDVDEQHKEPGKSAPMRTHRYNPLGYVSDDPADRMGDIDSIANAFYNNPNSKDKFFDEQAKDLFRGITLLVLETPNIPHTLGEVFRQSSGYGKALPEHLAEMIEKAQAENRPYSAACVDAIQRVCTLSDNTFAGVKGSMQVPLMPWANPRVDAATSANDFDLRDVRKKRMTIYLGITPNKLAEAKNIINIFFDQLINLNTRVLPQQDPTLKYQCLLILDEFTAAGKINQIAQSISYQAGYNMRVLTIIQNKSQLEDVYGKPGALTLMSNHALMIMYAPSPVVQQDANEYSEMLGYQTVKSSSHSKSRGKNGSKSESISDQKRALMLPQELKEMGMWEEIVSLEHTKPIFCNKIKYFEDPTFTARINWKIPSIPLIDLDTFLKGKEQELTSHELTQDDLNDHNFSNKVVGADELPSMDEIMNRLDVADENDVAEFIGKEILEKVAKPKKVDVDDLKAQYGTTDSSSDTTDLFADIEEDSDEVVVTAQSSPVVASTTTLSDDTNNLENTDLDTLSLLNQFNVSSETIEETSVADVNEKDNSEELNMTNSVLEAFGFNTSEPEEISSEDLGAMKRLNAQLGINEDSATSAEGENKQE